MIIGIDPGKNGGIVALREGTAPETFRMPATVHDLAGIFSELADAEAAFIEQVHSSPQMGVKSAFTFGQGFGHLEMGIAAHGIRMERVRPQVWQKALGCLTKGDKNITKARAQELFPDLKVIHAIADALLIAEYGRRLWVERRV